MADNVFFRGERPVRGMAFVGGGAAVLFALIRSAELALGIQIPDDGLTLQNTVLEAPIKEEGLFRLLPLILIAASKNHPAALAVGAAWSSFGFTAYHGLDDWFSPRFYQNMIGGAVFFGVAHTRGVSHSWAAHTGWNASAYAASQLF